MRKISGKEPLACGKVYLIKRANVEVCLGFERYDRSRDIPNIIVWDATKTDS